MDHLSARRQRLWEAMESCRGGTDDLFDPRVCGPGRSAGGRCEPCTQFQRLQQADEAIKVAFAKSAGSGGIGQSNIAATGRSNAGNKYQNRCRRHADRLETLSLAVPAATASNADVAKSDCPTPRRGTGSFFADAGYWSVSLHFRPQPPSLPPFGSRLTGLGTTRPSSVLEEAMDFFDNDNQVPLGRSSHRRIHPPVIPSAVILFLEAGYSLAPRREVSRAMRPWPTICPRSAAGPRSTWSRRRSRLCHRCLRIGQDRIPAASRPPLGRREIRSTSWLWKVMPGCMPVISINRTDR